MREYEQYPEVFYCVICSGVKQQRERARVCVCVLLSECGCHRPVSPSPVANLHVYVLVYCA